MIDEHFITGEELLFHIRSRSDIAVETIVIRDAIQAWRRRWGMTVGVWDDITPANNGIYLLKRGLVSEEIMDNDNWDKILTSSDSKSYVYHPYSVDLVVGNYVSGSVESVWEFGKGTESYIAQETNATPGFDLIFDFEGVEFFTDIWLHVRYTGGAGTHTVNIELWNYETLAWDIKSDFVKETSFEYIDIPVFNEAYVSEDGNARLRLNHYQAGHISHLIEVDFAALAAGGVGTPTIAAVVDDITLEGEGTESDPFRIKNLVDGVLYGIKDGAFFAITGLPATVFVHGMVVGDGSESDPVRIVNLDDGVLYGIRDGILVPIGTIPTIVFTHGMIVGDGSESDPIRIVNLADDKVYGIKNGALFEIETGGSSDDLIIPRTPTVNQTAKGIKTAFIAHENQAFGDVCRVNADGKAQLANATVIATSTGFLMCIDAAVLAEAEGNYLMYGFVRDDMWAWVVGEWIYLSRAGTTGGTLTQTNVAEELDAAEDEVIQVLGVANSATTFFFNPQLIQVEYRISMEE